MESHYEFMKRTESRLTHLRGSTTHQVPGSDIEHEIRPDEALLEDLNEVSIKPIMKPILKNQLTMDAFIGAKTSKLFDESFSIEDFRLITQRWREKNLVAQE